VVTAPGGWDAGEYQARFDALAASGFDVHGEVRFVLGLSPTSVLDAGCGTGRVAIELDRRGLDVIGVDVDPSMLATARSLAPGVGFVEADLTDPAFGLGRVFDLVLLAGNVPLFTRPGTQAALVAGCARHLAAGGLLVAGFQSGRGYELNDYDGDCAAVNLALVERWATWDRQPITPSGPAERGDQGPPYAVSVHRRNSQFARGAAHEEASAGLVVRWRPVPRRIDVELTSAKEDGSFTWRAAGAKHPKGVVQGSLLYGGAKVGDVIRAEADFDIEGITIVSVVAPPQAAARTQPTRIEIVGTSRDEPGVTSSAEPRQRRDDEDRPRSRDAERRGQNGGSERGARGASVRATPGRPDRGGRGPDDPSAQATRGPRPERAGPRSDRGERSGDGPKTSGTRPERAAPGNRPGRGPREQAGEKARPKRLSPGSAHRDAYLAGLTPEQQVVAELLFRGGVPAVRAAVAQQNQNRSEGAPVIDAEPLVGLAEGMLPAVREAEWRDRADAARAIIDEVGLRDLRAIVTAADASARGEEARALAGELRDFLDRRTSAQRDEWLAEMATCLAEGKVIRAVRLSSRPPDPTTKVPAEMLEQLRSAASEALGPDTPQDQWAALLEAVVASPVRRTVQPRGLPAQARPALQLAARQASGRIPALAAMLGVDLPPPPGPRPGRGPRPTPPPPPRPPRADEATAGRAAPASGAPMAGEPPAESGHAISDPDGSDPVSAPSSQDGPGGGTAAPEPVTADVVVLDDGGASAGSAEHDGEPVQESSPADV